jgi:hypothetical protein
MGILIVTPNSEVQIVIIIRYGYLGSFGGMNTQLKFPLGKMRDALRLLPNRIVQSPVQTRRLRCKDRLHIAVTG